MYACKLYYIQERLREGMNDDVNLRPTPITGAGVDDVVNVLDGGSVFRLNISSRSTDGRSAFFNFRAVQRKKHNM